MKVIQTYTKNPPSSAGGYSITVTITYSSHVKSEIDDIEKKIPKGIIIMDTDKPKRTILDIK